MVLDSFGKEQWGKGEYVPKPDQKSILDIVGMGRWWRSAEEEVASFSVDGTVGEALNGNRKRGKTGFQAMWCW